jgi:hypothetical protein
MVGLLEFFYLSPSFYGESIGIGVLFQERRPLAAYALSPQQRSEGEEA